MAKTFHKFSYLPFELRDSVWMEFLGEQPRQLYEFSLAPEPPALWHRVGMLYINPAESRRLAHRIFPDTIEFYLPDPDQVSPAPSSDVRPTPSSSVLRYNALRDVISVAAELSDRQMFIDAHLSGDPRTPTYHGIRHLGISAMSFFEYRAVFNQLHADIEVSGPRSIPGLGSRDLEPQSITLVPCGGNGLRSATRIQSARFSYRPRWNVNVSTGLGFDSRIILNYLVSRSNSSSLFQFGGGRDQKKIIWVK
ncbi:hypothetical protein SAPIO_CDS9809 [Scedosporium apiospermum]|uniref:Uncharacterized protein n=1 Tax=Pseudallescheria apiosperma TaxID=563466 RepID=A0A084FXL0_PSEDA|nr:uncharacterized protein SAPIO_CDS9809 [Scedosporium apiospermum]KEZ39822.1 hypothetical protein SAPIO_CDS9809 [Scedosporium apiospermum]